MATSNSADELNELHRTLLCDRYGNLRGAFFDVPLEFLQCAKNFHNTHIAEADFVSCTGKSLKSYVVENESGFGSSFRRQSQMPPEAVDEAEALMTSKIKDVLTYLGCSSYPESDIEWVLSILLTLFHFMQDPHVDFEHTDISRSGEGLRPRVKKLPYEDRVPFIAFFPLSISGMCLEIWPDAPLDDSSQVEKIGVEVHVPFGKALIVRGDTVHAGSRMTSPDNDGDPRGHLYVYQSGNGGVNRAPSAKNIYCFPDDTSFDRVFKHAAAGASATQS